MNMTRYEMIKINFIETIPWSSLHLYFDIWHLISPWELLRRGPKWRELTSLWPTHEIKFTTFTFRDLTSYFAIRIATARSKKDQSRLLCEPPFTLYLRAFSSHDFVSFTRSCIAVMLCFTVWSKNRERKIPLTKDKWRAWFRRERGEGVLQLYLADETGLSFRRKNPVFFRIIITMIMMMRMIYQGQGQNNFAEQLV